MSWVDSVARRFGFGRIGRRGQGYAAADSSRLTAALLSESQFINTTLRYQGRILRARSRQLAQNNPYARRYVQMVVDNVCGPEPFKLQGKVKMRSGKLDDVSNDLLEDCWKSWGRAGNCEVTGKWSWNTLQRLLVRNLCVDGEVLIRKMKGLEFGPHGMQLQLIDADRLWEHKNESLVGGGAIQASIEVDANGKPVAYWILNRKPAQWQSSGYTLDMERVPADEVIHLFVPDFAEQVRGVPWMYAAMLNLVHLGAFEEAAVIAARIGASQMGFIESPDGGQALADSAGKDAQQNPQIDVEPGQMSTLPPGYKFNAGWNPKYPDAAVEPFIRACLRGVSAGVGVAYHNLANDLVNVNYSSARIGELDERDMWLGLQVFVSDHLHQPFMCRDWMPTQVLMGKLPFNVNNLDRYRAVAFRGRRWAWVDPLKEVGAQIEAIEAKLKSRTAVIADQGEDITETWEEIQQEEAMAEDMDIDLDPVAPKVAGAVNEPGVAPGDAGSASDNADAGDSNKKRQLRAVPRYRDPAYTGDQ